MADAGVKPPPPLTSSPYPFAAAPDIIRAHQKDAYFQGVLTNQLSDLHRRLRGARSAHAWAAEARTAADLLYLCLTTLPGNRTLGEEYCDLVQVEAPRPSSRARRRRETPAPDTDTDDNTTEDDGGPLLPTPSRRAALVATSVLAPYIASLLMPRLRAALRSRLQSRLTALARRGPGPDGSGSRAYRAQRYLLAHLADLTSGSHLRAAALAVFYFTGAYYSLPKRLLGLRYVFTRRAAGDGAAGAGAADRVGYEVLGVLLAVQMLVRGYLHVRATARGGGAAEAEEEAAVRERVVGSGGAVEVSLDENAYSSNNALLVGAAAGGGGGQRSPAEIAASTHTPLPRGGGPRYDLAAEGVMGWIKGRQQRKCTLCLDGLRDPAATQCGHVFCWGCIGDWVREKPECPLCRREAMVQHILPLRAA